jgi:hypothetical protein
MRSTALPRGQIDDLRAERRDARPPLGRTDVFPRSSTLDRGQQFERRSMIERRDWHGAHVTDRDRHRWREGHWSRGVRGGRHGWWWVIGPAWYFYEVPVYPYPDPDSTVIVWEGPETVIADPPDSTICNEFHGDAVINDTGEPFYGTACLGPDGLWHIVTG